MDAFACGADRFDWMVIAPALWVTGPELAEVAQPASSAAEPAAPMPARPMPARLVPARNRRRDRPRRAGSGSARRVSSTVVRWLRTALSMALTPIGQANRAVYFPKLLAKNETDYHPRPHRKCAKARHTRRDDKR